MDRKYRIQRVIGEPDWDTIAKAAIDQCLWRLSFPAFVPSGKSRGKFYKFGDLTEREHYFAWNRVEAEHPDFHIPAYFGELFFLIDNSAPDPGSCGPGVLSDKQGHAWLIPVPGCAIIKQRAAVSRLDKSNRLTAADR